MRVKEMHSRELKFRRAAVGSQLEVAFEFFKRHPSADNWRILEVLMAEHQELLTNTKEAPVGFGEFHDSCLLAGGRVERRRACS